MWKKKFKMQEKEKLQKKIHEFYLKFYFYITFFLKKVIQYYDKELKTNIFVWFKGISLDKLIEF